MTPRPVPEWIGKTSRSRVPALVKDRILRRYNDRCADCTRAFGPHLKIHLDHRPALINGGENRESKIEPVCPECHMKRTHKDVRVRNGTRRIRAKFFGTKAPPRNPVPGSKASKWKRKFNKHKGRFETVKRT